MVSNWSWMRHEAVKHQGCGVCWLSGEQQSGQKPTNHPAVSIVDPNSLRTRWANILVWHRFQFQLRQLCCRTPRFVSYSGEVHFHVIRGFSFYETRRGQVFNAASLSLSSLRHTNKFLGCRNTPQWISSAPQAVWRRKKPLTHRCHLCILLIFLSLPNTDGERRT